MPDYDLEAMKGEIGRTDKNIQILEDEIQKLLQYKLKVKRWIEEAELKQQAEAEALIQSG